MNGKVKYYPISHGHIIATWNLIYLAGTYEEISPRTAVNIVIRTGKMGGTVPAQEGLKICLDYKLLSIKDGNLAMSPYVKDELYPTCPDSEPNTEALRQLLFHILSFHNFEWLIFYDPDPSIFRQYLLSNDREWVNLLDNANLFDFDEDNVVDWWDKILSKYENYKTEVIKAIGTVGEKLTYHFELNRINNDGFSPAKNYVKWASQISDRYGFDVMSIRGDLLLSGFSKKDKVKIEVKSTDADNVERFRFFVSRHEWSIANEDINSYYFFCWTGINIDKETARRGPFVIPAKDLVNSFPQDQSSVCQWSECRIVLDVSGYSVT